jgi:hypothetical protein
VGTCMGVRAAARARRAVPWPLIKVIKVIKVIKAARAVPRPRRQAAGRADRKS